MKRQSCSLRMSRDCSYVVWPPKTHISYHIQKKYATNLFSVQHAQSMQPFHSLGQPELIVTHHTFFLKNELARELPLILIRRRKAKQG